MARCLATWWPPPRVVVSATTLGNAAAAARGELSGRLVFVVAVATRQGHGTMPGHVVAAAARRGLGNHGTVHAA